VTDENQTESSTTSTTSSNNETGTEATAPATTSSNNETGAAGQLSQPPEAPPFGSDLSDEHRTFIDEKKWSKLEDAITSYKHLLETAGGDGVPKTDEERAALWDKMGRPEAPDKYSVKLSEDIAPIAEAAHKAGLTDDQFVAIGKAIADLDSDELDTMKVGQKYLNDLRTDVGESTYDKMMHQGREAARSLNLSTTDLQGMEQGLGTRRFMEIMSKLGEGKTETPFLKAKAAPQATREEARRQWEERTRDASFVTRLRTGDASALRERDEAFARMYR